MKKTAIAILLVAILALCGCASQTKTENGGTSAKAEVSSEIRRDGAAGEEQTSEGTDSQQEGGYEASGVPFDTESTTSGGSDSSADSKSTTENNAYGDEQGSEEDSTENATLPRVPIPQH